MTHLYRSEIFQKRTKKAIHSTKLVVSPHHSSNIGCIGGCRVHAVSPKDGYILHHRIHCKVNDNCVETKGVKYDPIILKYKTRLENNMKSVLAQIFT